MKLRSGALSLLLATICLCESAAGAELGDMDVVGTGARVSDKGPRQIQGMPAKKAKAAATNAKPTPTPAAKPQPVAINGWKPNLLLIVAD